MASYTGEVVTTVAAAGLRAGAPAVSTWSVTNRPGSAAGVVFGSTPPVVVSKTTGQLWPQS